jgi:hypothetical protein
MHLSEPSVKSEQKQSQNESRSYHHRSTNDLSFPQTFEFALHNVDQAHDHLSDKHKVKRTDANSHQDSRTLLKRFAPGQTSGYYLTQRHYHSLPHHYKLPTSINGQTSLTLQSSAEKNNSDSASYSEYSQKLAIILDWFKSFNSDQKNKMLTSLVQECEQPQNHLLSVLLQDKLHINCPANCQDFLLWLPRILAYKILSYLGIHLVTTFLLSGKL